MLLRLADRTLYAPLWSADIHEEWMRSLLADRPDIEAGVLERIRAVMDGHFPDAVVTGYEAIIATLDLPDPDYRRWDVRAELFVRKFRDWRADPILRDHVDRRWIDMSDLIAEFEAIRSAHPEPYRIETPDAFPARDQRHDPDRLAVLLRDVIRPEDERNHDAVVELARRNRAWPEETLAVFRSYAQKAANAGETRSLLSAGLPPHLGESLRNLSEVTWQYQGEDIERRRTLEQAYGMSY